MVVKMTEGYRKGVQRDLAEREGEVKLKAKGRTIGWAPFQHKCSTPRVDGT